MEVRQWLSRRRFSWVDLLSISVAIRLWADGHWIIAPLVIIVCAIAQALLEDWPK